MKLCIQCGRENMDHENFCSACGNNLNQSTSGKVCPNCQMVVGIDDRFCDNCGASLAEVPSGGLSSASTSAPNATRPMIGVTPPQGINQPLHTPIHQQPIVKPHLGQQPIGMQAGGYPQYNPATVPVTPTPAKKSKVPLLISLGLVILLAIGVGTYFLFFKDKEAYAPVTNDPTNVQSDTPITTTGSQTTGQNNSSNPKPKPTPPPTSNNNSTTNSGTIKPLGFTAMSKGIINFPVQFYQTLDFDGDGMNELVVGGNGEGVGHVDVLSWDMGTFYRTSYLEISGLIKELNSSALVGGVQQLFVPSFDNLTYILYSDNGSYVYDIQDMGLEVLSIAEGDFDYDGYTDLAILHKNDVGYEQISFLGTEATEVDPLYPPEPVYNMFFADLDGDTSSDLLYMAVDDNEVAYVYIATWTGQTFELVGGTTFGDNLMNFFPGDVDNDGVYEIVTSNYTMDGTLEGRVWKWSNERLEFVLIDIFTIEDSDAYWAVPLVGDINGDGHVDILVVTTKFDQDNHGFILYSR